MLFYGAAIVGTNAWLKQIVKRGWTEWEVPDPIRPSISPIWGTIVVATAILVAVLRRPTRAARGSGSPS